MEETRTMLLDRLEELVCKYGHKPDEQDVDKFDLPEGTEVIFSIYDTKEGLAYIDTSGENVSVTYVGITSDATIIGVFTWEGSRGENFDDDAEWHVLDISYFNEWELEKIISTIEQSTIND